MTLEVEGVVDGGVDAQKPLCQASGFEALHFPLPPENKQLQNKINEYEKGFLQITADISDRLTQLKEGSDKIADQIRVYSPIAEDVWGLGDAVGHAQASGRIRRPISVPRGVHRFPRRS